MHQTTLPRGKHKATDPWTGVTAADVETADAETESAEATGVAIMPRGKAMAVAATILIIVWDMSSSLST
jgi:hypothetical protein